MCPRCEGQKYDKGTCSLCGNTGRAAARRALAQSRLGSAHSARARGEGGMSEPVRIGDATLYLGDCLEILPSLGRWTPWSLTRRMACQSFGLTELWAVQSRSVKRWAGQINPVYADFSGDDKPIDPAPLLAIGTEHILWGGNYMANKLPASVRG